MPLKQLWVINSPDSESPNIANLFQAFTTNKTNNLFEMQLTWLKSREICESHQFQHGVLKNKRKMNNRGIFLLCFFIPWGILANVKISRLSAFSSWLCDLFPSCIALGLRPWATHEGNKSHNPLPEADNFFLIIPYQCCTLITKLPNLSCFRRFCNAVLFL